ncbi:MAG: (2Fe-2S)-binding protein [Alphaproteobacteria bacterium]|nr:(2Fe-2S)-binding protein [Alphaproteobacteria bacterium]
MDDLVVVSMTVNGRAVRRAVSPRQSLADFLRQDLGLTGTHLGCEHGVCGACTIVVDGRIQRGCLSFAAQMEGHTVETIEGATASGRLAALQTAFRERNALQCGFCTPGILLTAAEFLADNPRPIRDAIRTALSGNVCRCTGYHAIVDAVASAAEALS